MDTILSDMTPFRISDKEVMRAVYDAGADGMTVNFPDKLISYIAGKNAALTQENG